MTDDLTQALAEPLARRFHELYEQLAPSFGYVTREDTRQFDPDSQNGRLMIAVCALLSLVPEPALAELQALRDERDYLREELGITEGMLVSERAELAPLRAQVERLTVALRSIADFTEKSGHEFARLHPKLDAALDALPQDRWAEVLSELAAAALTEGAAP